MKKNEKVLIFYIKKTTEVILGYIEKDGHFIIDDDGNLYKSFHSFLKNKGFSVYDNMIFKYKDFSINYSEIKRNIIGNGKRHILQVQREVKGRYIHKNSDLNINDVEKELPFSIGGVEIFGVKEESTDISYYIRETRNDCNPFECLLIFIFGTTPTYRWFLREKFLEEIGLEIE